MKLFITLTKRKLAVILAALILGIIIAGQLFSANSDSVDGSTDAIRVRFLKSLGYIAEETGSDCKGIIIPEEFNEVYSEYNELQKKADFDLRRYRGCEALLYTYSLTDGRQAHIIVLNGRIIGGDIAEVSLNGEMKPLKGRRYGI